MMGARCFVSRGTHADARPQPVRAVRQMHVSPMELGLNQAAVELRSLHEAAAQTRRLAAVL